MVPAPNRSPSSSCPPQSKDPGPAGAEPNLSLRSGSWALTLSGAGTGCGVSIPLHGALLSLFFKGTCPLLKGGHPDTPVSFQL